MKTKKTLAIVFVALILLAAAFFLWKQCGAQEKPLAEKERTPVETVTEDASQNQPEEKTEAEQQETAEETESSGAVLLENQGEIEIIIPEDEESDGF